MIDEAIAFDMMAGLQWRKVGGETTGSVVLYAERVAADHREIVRQTGMRHSGIMRRQSLIAREFDQKRRQVAIERVVEIMILEHDQINVIEDFRAAGSGRRGARLKRGGGEGESQAKESVAEGEMAHLRITSSGEERVESLSRNSRR